MKCPAYLEEIILSKAKMETLYAEIRAKTPLSYKTRKALLSHWRPRVAKAICRAVYPDFRGTYEQHLWLLTHKAAEPAGETKPVGYTTYAWEAKEKGILFLWPCERIEDTRLCGPSHYMYYILNWKAPQVNAILAYTACRHSARLNAKHLIKALALFEIYRALPSGAAARKERKKALDAVVKAQIMLSVDNLIEYQVIAYGWTHLRKEASVSISSSPAAQTLAKI